MSGKRKTPYCVTCRSVKLVLFKMFINQTTKQELWLNRLSHLRENSHALQSAKKLVSMTLPEFLNFFALGGNNPLKRSDTPEHEFAEIDYQHGEIPRGGSKADGIGYLLFPSRLPVVWFEGSRAVAKNKTKEQDQRKVTENLGLFLTSVATMLGDAGEDAKAGLDAEKSNRTHWYRPGWKRRCTPLNQYRAHNYASAAGTDHLSWNWFAIVLARGSELPVESLNAIQVDDGQLPTF
ncbi:hypothetical protein BC832DRAFT_616983 [Gaertneriomyces semiglobifer]|nr:hypothetical protein BC832DRAFT_616983 [Gaertneriomyces semiglobifer]